MQNDTNAPDVGNKDGLAGGDVVSGRELDALIGQYVTRARLPDAWFTRVDGRVEKFPDRYPAYSTDGSATVEVLEAMRSAGWHCCTEGEAHHQWLAYFYHDGQPGLPGKPGQSFRADGDTLPEAVCRAALTTVKTEPANH